MKTLRTYAKFIPYCYFIAITFYWFLVVNKSEGLTAYPILLFAIPFIWQILKPNRELNFSLGIVFACISSYLIIGYVSDFLNIPSLILAKGIIIYGGIFAFLNFVMSAWIIRNSVNRAF